MGAGNPAQSLEVLESKDLLYDVIGDLPRSLHVGDLIESEFASKIPWEDIDTFSSAYQDKLREFVSEIIRNPYGVTLERLRAMIEQLEELKQNR